MEDNTHETIRRLAALAGMSLPEERITALAQILLFVRAQVACLADLDYGEAEPASRFHPHAAAPR